MLQYGYIVKYQRSRLLNRTVVLFVLGIYGKSWAYWFGMVTEFIRTVLMRVVTTFIVSKIAGDIAVGKYTEAKNLTIWFVVVALVAIAIGTIGEMLTILLCENRQYHKQSLEYYRRITNKDMAFYKDHQTGFLTASYRQHNDSLIALGQFIRLDLVRLVVTLLFTVGMLFYASPLVGFVSLGVLGVQLGYILWASRQATLYRQRTHLAYRQLSGAVADDITNIVALRSAGNQKAAEARVSAFDQAEANAYDQRRKIILLLDVPRSVITQVGSGLALWIVASNADTMQAAVESMVLVVTYLIQISRNVDLVPDLITKFDDLVTKIYPTLDYLQPTYESVREPAAAKTIVNCRGDLHIQDVHFSYKTASGKSHTVFDRLNLHVYPGEQVGVVGLSGAGKSTLASLIMRFDDVDDGAITIDGVNIRDMRQDDLHQQMAYVPQEPLLFHRSIRENIMYFRPDATEAQIVRAAKAAHAHQFITNLSDGYDTLVGERGVKLSGGQKQRIAIARAVLKNAPIMLFDEATSALDSESERIIQAAMPSIIGKKTALVIAHRLSTIAGLDRIIVMHGGCIEEQGTHSELLSLKGRYYTLWQKQTTQ